ncbi:phospholipase C/P1 nuclease domain-containing protein [Schizophyllum amplum]|uniref:Phospholipase C/P1 nuclease domain-containing protein n=1 Tax=Schizophyllum amplum TaxID=97359 RepID=A0A550D0P5_9AGAR|nr:phospholipase C/P1 nuclease domain-containing protein [Auriculariopsis ampla]
MRIPFHTIILAAVASAPRVAAWGAAGHEIVATIAQMYLHPSALPAICDILNFTSTNPNEPRCHLAPIATWADRYKYRMRWSAPLHYIGALDDYPSETCLFPGDRGWAGRDGGNVLAGIRNTTGLLEDWVAGQVDDDVANEALKFLVHFVGDMHMPLHLTGRDRGGNSDKVTFGGRQSNLHSVWDGLLIAKSLRTIPYNYTKPLPEPAIEYNLRDTIYDPYVRRVVWEGLMGEWKDEAESWLACPATTPTAVESPSLWQKVLSTFTGGITQNTDDDVLCPHHWAAPIHALNCDIVWPKALDEPPYSRAVSRFIDAWSTEQAGHGDTPKDEYEMMDANGNFIAGELRPGSPYLELDTPEYAGIIAERKIIEKLMAQAGVRLAAILNSLFAAEDAF